MTVDEKIGAIVTVKAGGVQVGIDFISIILSIITMLINGCPSPAKAAGFMKSGVGALWGRVVIRNALRTCNIPLTPAEYKLAFESLVQCGVDATVADAQEFVSTHMAMSSGMDAPPPVASA